MKAEERKELETNALADRMGKAIQRVKRPSDRRTVVYAILAAALLGLALYVGLRWWTLSRSENADRWVQLEDGAKRNIDSLIQFAPETNQGKAARLQRTWIIYWETGVKMLANDPVGAFRAMDQMGQEYKRLAEECKDDPTYGPEALYGLAVIEETRAVQNRIHLESAVKMYEDVKQKHEKSAFGRLAAERLEVLNDTKKRAEVVQFYQDLQISLRVPEQMPPQMKGLGAPPPPPPTGDE